ncbi:MAG: cytochrome c oxidase assembly factor CtaG [Bacillales bacterium]|nr:cytochrome c oxidase assembly factor CtaG [Bacillales bacterium]
MSISIFGFQALWSPYFMMAILLITAFYLLLTIKWREYFPNSKPLAKKELLYFISAMVLLYCIKGSPIDLMSHIMFSYHMVQMAILCLVLPPILIKGIPAWLWEYIIELPVIRPIFSLMTKPLIAAIAFNGLFSFYHIPDILDKMNMSETLHGLYTVALFVFALFMWWPLMNHLPGNSNLSGLRKVAYLFADAALLTPACGLIIFSGHPLYNTYSDPSSWLQSMQLCVPTNTLNGLELSGPELFSHMPVIEDQQLGGVLMKMIQEIVYGIVLARIFFDWYRKEQLEADQITEASLREHQSKW